MLGFLEKKMLSCTEYLLNLFDDTCSLEESDKRDAVMELVASKENMRQRILKDLRNPNMNTNEILYLNGRLNETNSELDYLNRQLQCIPNN